MKASILGWAVSLVGISYCVAQVQQPPPPAQPSQPSLSYQIQPSEVEKAQATVWRPKLKTQITYSGPLVDVARGQNLLEPLPTTNGVRAAHDDLSVDLITRRPRGIVLFAVNF